MDEEGFVNRVRVTVSTRLVYFTGSRDYTNLLRNIQDRFSGFVHILSYLFRLKLQSEFNFPFFYPSNEIWKVSGRYDSLKV